MNDELKIQTSALAEFVCDGNEALQFRLVRQDRNSLVSSHISLSSPLLYFMIHFMIGLLQVKSTEDLEDPEACFKPEMCHQIYGDNENIFGYKGLEVSLFMTAGSLQTFLSHSYKEKVDPSKTDGVTADDVISPLVKYLAPGSFTDNRETFIAQVNSEQEQNFR